MSDSGSTWMKEVFRRELAVLSANLTGLAEALEPALTRAALLLVRTLRGEGTVFFCGNGGSAAQAMHLASELAVKLDRDRGPLRALALGGNTPLLTASANDLGYEEVWVRELSSLARPGDALVILTTSGNSPNVIRAGAYAGERGLKVVGFLGRGGGRVASHCEVKLVPEGESAQRIQEIHLFLGHLLCNLVETEFLGWAPAGGS